MKPATLLMLTSAALLALAACKDEQAAIPQPVAMNDQALGYYCQMALSEHAGPKAQVHLADTPAPLFFAQVRDALAYMRMPEQSAPITAIHVNDMSHAPSWQDPGPDNWVAANEAWFVVGSDAIGGMGAAEVVPFSQRADAEAFAARSGGRVMRLPDIPDEALLAPAKADEGRDEDSRDYLDRLRAIDKEGDS